PRMRLRRRAAPGSWSMSRVCLPYRSPTVDRAPTLSRYVASRSQVVAAGLFQQAAAVSLHRDQVPEQGVVLVALVHRWHALKLGFDLGDLPSDPYFLQAGQHSADIARHLVVVVD